MCDSVTRTGQVTNSVLDRQVLFEEEGGEEEEERPGVGWGGRGRRRRKEEEGLTKERILVTCFRVTLCWWEISPARLLPLLFLLPPTPVYCLTRLIRTSTT